MILVVTLNPLLERRFSFNEVKFGNKNRNGIISLSAGGKGINVSRQLNLFNIENLSFTFLGGNNGKILKDVIRAEELKLTSVKTKNETRDAALIFENNKNQVTTCFGENTKILKSEVEEFKSKLEKMIETCEMVIFSGSSPCEEADIIFPFGIKIANQLDKISICDTYGNHLSECIKSSPTIIHNNVSEIETSFNISLKKENNKIEFLNLLYQSGIKQAYITNGAETIYASNIDFHFKVEVPLINAKDSTGSGDAFTSGIAFAWHNNLTFEEGLIFAIKLGILNASKFETCNITFDEIIFFQFEPNIISIGKTINTKNVPHN